jgi:hypothetical protein
MNKVITFLNWNMQFFTGKKYIYMYIYIQIYCANTYTYNTCKITLVLSYFPIFI